MIVIAGSHCQSCGSTSREDIDTGHDEDLQGYTACCNERVIDICNTTDCYHGDPS